MIPWAYTVPVTLAVPAVVALELFVLRTGLFRTSAYWVTMAIVTAFQVPVDGWLTKLPTPVVRYSPAAISGVRFPWDIPIEDFLFGFVLTTAALMLWRAVDRE
ncbi:MAG TPA: lycopene cyclase domain-containing protein [Amycolatopsis sp.]|uniref:lycopene cyclase domain-containing protein n=1 Tax=Amycolatopsis sp. TaxID=37632 RepID=UPI002B492C90|nr:lycopene cyclase domain-containing protein [Amycolatopsis sp.]HKS46114.1 lycopene cyclase domain-containing protein [Amycolatopsis sp.]